MSKTELINGLKDLIKDLVEAYDTDHTYHISQLVNALTVIRSLRNNERTSNR
jgi:hypothetical protein